MVFLRRLKLLAQTRHALEMPTWLKSLADLEGTIHVFILTRIQLLLNLSLYNAAVHCAYSEAKLLTLGQFMLKLVAH